MPKLKTHKGQFVNHPGICMSGEGAEDNLAKWSNCIEAFYSEQYGGDETGNLLETALNSEGLREEFGYTPQLLLWSVARSHIVESKVCRLFASDCLANTAERLSMNTKTVMDAIECARDYAMGECDHEGLMATRATIEDLAVEHEGSPTACPKKNFVNVLLHVLSPHPDGGAIQCIMNLPRCLEWLGENAKAESAWQLEAFKTRCEEAGYFDD